MKLTTPRRVLCALFLLATVVSLAGCAASPTPATGQPALDLEPAPWQDGDTASYVWLDPADTQIGVSHIELSLLDDAWRIAETDQIAELIQVVDMRISAAALAPLSEVKTIEAPDTSAVITSTFTGGRLSIQAMVNEDERSATLDVPANAIANDQLLMSLRALPFAAGYQADYVVVVPDSAQNVEMTVTVQRQETIEVPAGSFNTWYVEMDFGQTKQYGWYQVDAPHMLIQYSNGTNRMVLAPAQAGLRAPVRTA